MAALIAVLIVAFMFWQSQQRQRSRLAIEPPPAPDEDSDTQSIAIAPTAVVAAPRPASAPWQAVPTAGEAEAPGNYAFASRRAGRGVDRTAAIVLAARGKGLCSPRRQPS